MTRMLKRISTPQTTEQCFGAEKHMVIRSPHLERECNYTGSMSQIAVHVAQLIQNMLRKRMIDKSELKRKENNDQHMLITTLKRACHWYD